jgi:toxin secretion/phage lysis holin
MNFLDYLKIAAAGIGAALSWVWGPWDTLLIVLAVVMLIDYASGVLNAFYHKKASSKIGLQGILKKIGIALMVGLACLLDRVMPLNGAIRTAVLIFFICNEGVSILENMGAMGLPLPNALKNALKQLERKSEDAVPPEQKPPNITG